MIIESAAVVVAVKLHGHFLSPIPLSRNDPYLYLYTQINWYVSVIAFSMAFFKRITQCVRVKGASHYFINRKWRKSKKPVRNGEPLKLKRKIKASRVLLPTRISRANHGIWGSHHAPRFARGVVRVFFIWGNITKWNNGCGLWGFSFEFWQKAATAKRQRLIMGNE